MDIDLEAAAKYPMQSEDWLKTIGIGGVLMLLSIFIVPIFLLYGYFVRVLRAGMREEREPPAFGDWGSLLSEGFWAFVVIFVYQLIPLIVFAVTVGGSVLAMAGGGRAGAGVGVAGLLGGMTISALLALVFGYVGLVGVANYAHGGSLGDGFDFGVIKRVGLSWDYAVPWVVGVVAMFVAGAIASILGIVPIIGAIAGVFVTFYGYVVAGKIWGQGYADALGLASPDAGTSEPGTSPSVD
ncbi:DUF4013 domain-containing protein [Salinirarus marinus]|uniref:DUF4013 domain-containing protein n=1 Tax=Salinirarus marinus TaxID=3068310 RepID=UPI003C6C1C3E